ncbi:MAG TPA: hypothetical protein VKM55_00640 [Candidatus Lokiarchaeia archaeon]|nr:hypothetical protein [Candidatus Lokiarchaeia archaeon]
MMSMEELKKQMLSLRDDIIVEEELHKLIKNLNQNLEAVEKREDEFIELITKSQKINDKTLLTRFTI